MKCFFSNHFKKIMDQFGCTIPFVSNTEKICSEKEKSIQALKLFKNMKDSMFESCPYPCEFLRITASPNKIRDHENDETQGEITITFNKYIRVTDVKYSYTALELLAEFGGYVGLFLGISVFHFSDLFDKILDWCIPLY